MNVPGSRRSDGGRTTIRGWISALAALTLTIATSAASPGDLRLSHYGLPAIGERAAEIERRMVAGPGDHCAMRWCIAGSIRTPTKEVSYEHIDGHQKD